MSFPDLIYYSSVYSVLLPLVAGLLRPKRLERDSVWILVLVFLASIPQILPLHLEYSGWDNILYNGYTLAEFVVLMMVFRMQSGDSSFRRTITASAFAYIIVACLQIVKAGIKEQFLNELLCLNHIIYVFWCLLYIRLLALEKEAAPFEIRTPLFWFFAGILIYAPCSIIVLALDSRIYADERSILQQLRTIHGIFNISMYVCFAIGMLKGGFNKSTQTKHHPQYESTLR